MKEFDLEDALENVINNDMVEEDLIILHNLYCDYSGQEGSKILDNNEDSIEELLGDKTAYDIITHIDEYDESEPYVTLVDNEYLKSLYDATDFVIDANNYANYWLENPNETDGLTTKYEKEIISEFSEFCEEEYGIDYNFIADNVCADEVVKDWESTLERLKDEYSTKN